MLYPFPVSSLLYCAVDLGAESGRVVEGRFDGATLKLDVAHRFLNLPARTGAAFHWDVLRLWNDICDGLAKVEGDVAGIGVDTWGVDFGLLDARDELIGNPVHYRDERHTPYLEIAAQTMPQAEIYARTGLQFLPFNTLYQLLAMKANSPQLPIARTLLWMPDLLHFWLCGAKKNEYSIASTGQLLDARARSYDEDLLRQFDLPASIFCDLVLPGTNLGNLRPAVAARLGLSKKTPVIAPATHDTASAIAAVPFEPGENSAYLSSGTWSLMGVELDQPLLSERAFELGFTNEGGVSGTIRFLKNIAGLWLVQECRRSFERAGNPIDYAAMTQMAAQINDGPFVEPDDACFAAPLDMPTALREVCAQNGQSEPQSPGELVRCCLDSLALKYRWTFERLEELRGPLDALRIVGGGTQNELLSQLTADCIGKPVICGPIEATAIGNALIQAMGSGQVRDLAQIRAIVRASFPTTTFEPRASEKAKWDEKFGIFEKLKR